MVVVGIFKTIDDYIVKSSCVDMHIAKSDADISEAKKKDAFL